MFNAVVHVARLGDQSVNLVVSVAVVVLLFTFVKSCLFFEEVLDKGLLTVREFWGVVVLLCGQPIGELFFH